ncbi:hypothetical protein [Streptosporangium lutulentum]|uniref:hypothetical protein n=1 Tax=Streptosporangium lutulentum TaxID=1461250 RepID=UPI0027D8F6E6|nr:hypothetical protein [Streptosporangium lutulentum]
MRLLPGGDEHEQFPPGIAPGAGPGAMWGLGQVATYLGRSREAVRLYWLASRARAVDPHAATAADALPVPDFLLPDKGAGVHGFFDVRGPAATEWWAVESVRPLWRPQVIAAWASTTGRAVRDGDRYRLPVPLYLDLPALSAPLPRTVDAVVQVPAGYRTTATQDLHLRIWDGPLPSVPGGETVARRTVVLLAATDPASGFALDDEDLAAHLRDAGLITGEQARRALWFMQSPSHHPDVEAGRMLWRPQLTYLSFEIFEAAPDRVTELPLRQRVGQRISATLHQLDGGPARALRFPTRLPATAAQLEHLVGERLEIYPRGMHTPAVIARWSAGERPVTVAWDPVGLGEDLAQLPVLVDALSAARAALARATPDADRRPLQRRVAVIRAAASWVASIAHGNLNHGCFTDPYAPEQLPAVTLQMPLPTDADRLLIKQVLADDESEPYQYSVLLRDLAAITALADEVSAEAASADQDGAPDPGAQLAAALRQAVVGIGEHFHPQVRLRVGSQQWIPARIELATAASSVARQHVGERTEGAAYLQTIAWWGPRPEDREMAYLLARLFFDYEHDGEDGLACGYDPFGRLVMHCPAAEAFAIGWPTNGVPEIADLGTWRFRPLADRRIDLIPIAASTRDPA